MWFGSKKWGGVKSLQMDRERSGGAKLVVVAIEGRESAGHWSAWWRRNLKNHKK